MEEKSKETARPLYDRVFIEELGDMPTKNSLLAQWDPNKDASDSSYKVGRVVANGLKCTEVNVNDVVAYNKFKTLEICIDTEVLQQIREQDIMYVYENFDYSKVSNKSTIFEAAKKTTTLGI
jgi:co-chaperonin GroES (HSP10)